MEMLTITDARFGNESNFCSQKGRMTFLTGPDSFDKNGKEHRTFGFDWEMTLCFRRRLGSTPDTFLASVTEAFFPRVFCTRCSHLESGHYFLAPYLASFGVEVSPAEYAVWTFWEMAPREGFRLLWFDSGHSSYVNSRRLMEVIRAFPRGGGLTILRSTHIVFMARVRAEAATVLFWEP